MSIMITTWSQMISYFYTSYMQVVEMNKTTVISTITSTVSKNWTSILYIDPSYKKIPLTLTLEKLFYLFTPYSS